jgi:hypothetical protein
VNKKRAIEGIQVLMLRNAIEKDYLEGALSAAVANKFSEAQMFIDLAKKLETGDVDLSSPGN